MRLNRLLATSLNISRRKADNLIASGQISINNEPAQFHSLPIATDVIKFQGKEINISAQTSLLVMLNKPTGYVCSRNGQGSNTIYDIIPDKYHALNPIGRLDKNSSGLILLTNNGQLHQKLTHPKYEKQKVYQVKLNKKLQEKDLQAIEKGVQLEDGLSKMQVKQWLANQNAWLVTIHEGRNRQIRRSFSHLGYRVIFLNRIIFGPYELGQLKPGNHKLLH